MPESEGDTATAAEAEEEEPRLKYQRLGASVTEILEEARSTCLCVSDKILALGTHDGSVHVLDVSGNEVGSGLKIKQRMQPDLSVQSP